MNNLVHESRFLRFYKYTIKGRKTPIYYIRPVKDDFIMLGSVQWHTGFRKYAFYPMGDTVFDKQCLEDIVYFIEECAGKEGY